MIESAISSNRIEGVNVDQSRINTLILGKPFLKDRDEEEVRGYRDVLHLIHEKAEFVGCLGLGAIWQKKVIPLKRGNKKGNKKDVWRNYLIKKSMWRSPLTNRKLLGHW